MYQHYALLASAFVYVVMVFSCVYCIVFHWMDSPHCDLL